MSFTVCTFLKHNSDRNMVDEMSGACTTQTKNSYMLVGKTVVNISVEYVVVAQVRIGGCMYGL
jgi:hypothetical protein